MICPIMSATRDADGKRCIAVDCDPRCACSIEVVDRVTDKRIGWRCGLVRHALDCDGVATDRINISEEPERRGL